MLYVDDVLIANTVEYELNETLDKLQTSYKLKINRDLKRILGINVNYNRDHGITTIHQSDKIEEMAKLIEINDNDKLPTVPLNQSVRWFTSKETNENEILNEEESSWYRTLLGKAMYIMTATRPDICFSVSLLSRANKAPTRRHIQGITHLVKYLLNTLDWKITFKRHHPIRYKLLAYSDADWATDLENRRSQTGGIIFLGGTPIVWLSTQQTTVAVSSTEAEVNALREVTKQALWTRNVMKELGLLHQQCVLILEDNTSAILLVHNPAVNNVNRHTDISQKFMMENIIEFKTISVEYVPTNLNIADAFTKILKEPQGLKLNIAIFHMYLQPNGINNI